MNCINHVGVVVDNIVASFGKRQSIHRCGEALPVDGYSESNRAYIRRMYVEWLFEQCKHIYENSIPKYEASDINHVTYLVVGYNISA
jgi:hypothetical protein